MVDISASTKQPEPEQPVAVDEKSSGEDAKKLSKRAMRKEKRRLQSEERKAVKKLKRKEQQRVKKANGLIPPPKELDMSEEAVQRRKDRAIARREAYLMAAEEGVKVVIDCEFEEEMNEKEKKSLSQQIMFSYGVNRKSRTPMNAYITSLHGDIRKNLEKISGFHEWQAFTGTSKSYMDLFKKESLVYLTADSPNTITKLSRDKVYIIGGIVDRNRLKGITYEKAVEQGIETAKLPLDIVVEMGSATRVLTVNHVFEILAQFSEIKDWAQATLSTLPSRKGAHLKLEK
ncbi:Calcium permeable stress-gated cation channel 1 [Phytophthora nicotianae]|uniref:tRNA (guanine(9)-N(1))-methyltransferase n=1 Tax=Phytophthora nicotianae TaxID=4792 RepID=A0A0W8DJ50_PHYNI|nr:Calcium permeable stress-gated cation channel 1 [Phytophthora nicotianae]